MARITVRIPDELKERMDDMEEINWSAEVREALENRVAAWEQAKRWKSKEPEFEEV